MNTMRHAKFRSYYYLLHFLMFLPIFLSSQSTGAAIRARIWYNNVPHPKLVEYKKDQNWVTRSGDYLVFPGGGTQFKDGVGRYIQFVEQVNIQFVGTS